MRILLLFLTSIAVVNGGDARNPIWVKEILIDGDNAPKVIEFVGIADDGNNVKLTVDGVDYAFSFEKQNQTLIIDFIRNRKLLYCLCCESMETWLIVNSEKKLKIEAVYVKKGDGG